MITSVGQSNRTEYLSKSTSKKEFFYLSKSKSSRIEIYLSKSKKLTRFQITFKVKSKSTDRCLSLFILLNLYFICKL